MSLQLHRPPLSLPLLKMLEWILLATVTIVAVVVQLAYATSALLLVNLLGVAIFAALGWISPQQRSHQIFYTAIEFGLVFLLVVGGKIPLFPLLLIVLAIRNCQILAGWQGWMVSALAFSVSVTFQTYRLFIDRPFPIKLYSEQILPLWIGLVLIYGLTFLFLHLLVQAIATEQKNRSKLAVANARLQASAWKIEELATLEERNRIAREIHDSLGHNLTVFNFHLQAAIRLFASNPERAMELLLEARQLGDSALQEVSRSVSSLRQDLLEDRSLEEAIADLVARFHQTTGVMPLCEIDISFDLPDRHQTTIYRMVQESLTNMSKYAEMTQVQIQIGQTGRAIHLCISDNGTGFELHNNNSTGFGLQGMRERVKLLSGQLDIVTAPGCGCKIVAILPLA